MKHIIAEHQMNSKKCTYVSCIKISGVPILPPLITPEKRKELRRFRREAIKIDKRLQRERELKNYIADLYRSCSTDFNNDDYSTTIGNIDEEVNASNIIKVDENHLRNEIYSELNDSLAHEPGPDQIEATNNDLLQDQEQPILMSNESNEANQQKNNAEETKADDESVGNEKESSQKRSITPKLLRSNSYVLDAPSPALVEYFKKTEGRTVCWDTASSSVLAANSISSETYSKDDCDPFSEVVINTDVSLDSVKSDCISVIDSTLKNHPDIIVTHDDDDLQVVSLDEETPRLPNDTSDKSNDHNLEATPSPLLNITVSDDCFEDTSCTETELKHLSPDDTPHNPPTSENLQEFIDNNKSVMQDEIVSNLSHSNMNQTGCNELDAILKNIPIEYSRRILDILEKYQFTNYKEDRFEDICLQPEKYSTPHETTAVNANETEYFSVFETDSTLDEPIRESPEDGLIRESPEDGLGKEAQKDVELQKRDEAATILCAVAKGFLVRRLLKTEKVQHLIQTIKDTLLCAIELHKDTLDHIEKADVELHRRLIQQVSAACFAFHDVFFATSVQDQMSFISVDRQKKQEKARRLLSASSISSNRSTSSLRSVSSVSDTSMKRPRKVVK